MGEIHAQKSIGASFSYAGVGLSYEHGIDERSFAEIQLRMETTALYSKRSNGMGGSASFSWNMLFANHESRDGSRIEFFAGPGIMGGFVSDVGRKRGLMIGLKGRIGGECTFRRNVIVSLSLAPVIGVHFGMREGTLNMLIYKNGLMYGIMPEVGIKYAF